MFFGQGIPAPGVYLARESIAAEAGSREKIRRQVDAQAYYRFESVMDAPSSVPRGMRSRSPRLYRSFEGLTFWSLVGGLPLEPT